MKIIRTKTVAKGGITPEEKLRLDAHAEKWIKIAMRTEAIEPAKIIPAIKAVYAAANLKEPRVIIVPSPRIMALAGGFAAAIWWLRNNPGKFVTTAATLDATLDATRAATYAATYAATLDATDAAKPLVKFFLMCAQNWYRMYQGGNMWAAWNCYLSSFRDILGLELPIYGKYYAWEQAGIHGGFRIVHKEFCMVSDFPEILKVDAERRPHSDSGPSHKWSDGWSLYYWHGVKVTRQIIDSPETLTVKQIQEETNAEVRRVMMERFGLSRFLIESGAKKLSEDEFGQLYRTEVPDDEPLLMVKVLNSTPEPDGSMKPYFLRVQPELRPMLKDGLGEPQTLTALNGVASTFGMTGAQYLKQLVEQS